jgi:hypothetical protein
MLYGICCHGSICESMCWCLHLVKHQYGTVLTCSQHSAGQNQNMKKLAIKLPEIENNMLELDWSRYCRHAVWRLVERDGCLDLRETKLQMGTDNYIMSILMIFTLEIVRIAAGLRARLSGDWIPGRNKRCSFLQKCPNRFRGPPSLLFTGYRFFPQGVKRSGHDVDHGPESSAKVKNEWSHTSIPSVCLYTFTFTIYS